VYVRTYRLVSTRVSGWVPFPPSAVPDSWIRRAVAVRLRTRDMARISLLFSPAWQLTASQFRSSASAWHASKGARGSICYMIFLIVSNRPLLCSHLNSLFFRRIYVRNLFACGNYQFRMYGIYGLEEDIFTVYSARLHNRKQKNKDIYTLYMRIYSYLGNNLF
jgi:hypothetical protein